MRRWFTPIVLGFAATLGVVGCGGEDAKPPAEIQQQNLDDELNAQKNSKESSGRAPASGQKAP